MKNYLIYYNEMDNKVTTIEVLSTKHYIQILEYLSFTPQFIRALKKTNTLRAVMIGSKDYNDMLTYLRDNNLVYSNNRIIKKTL